MKFKTREIVTGRYVWSGWEEDSEDFFNREKHIHWNNHPCKVEEVGDDRIVIYDYVTGVRLTTNKRWFDMHVRGFRKMRLPFLRVIRIYI